MRAAIAQSSDVYFYEIAGGFPGQKGLGIARMEQYARMFGYGSTTGIDLAGESVGTIPSPEWKKKMFVNDPTWRIGDTYFTGIGQYGMQVTVLQALREAAIIASDGLVVRPHLSSTAATSSTQLDIPSSYFKVAKEGMRKVVTVGSAPMLNMPEVKIAAKTGTAELGIRVRWVTEITHVQEPQYFADEQRFGPYALWHHKHHFKSVAGGIEMTDEVDYAIPLGLLGRLAHWIFVGRAVNRIFDHRYTVLEKYFAPKS
jgi:penicillin-binding protein 2